MLFRIADGKALANYCVHTSVTSIAIKDDGSRLVIGGEDGSVMVLVVAALEDPEGLKTDEEMKHEASSLLSALPSRRTKRPDGAQTTRTHSEEARFAQSVEERRILAKRRFR